MKKRYILGGLAGAIALAPVALYALAPRKAFDLFRSASRKRGGLATKFIDVDGSPWPYLESGPADGEPLLLLHGFGGDKDNWTFYAPHISKKYRVIAPDLPGFGENSRVVGRDYSMAAQADRVTRFMDALAIPNCHVGGNSMGGFIALYLALNHAERVKTLSLFNSAGVKGTSESALERAVAAGYNPLQVNSPEDVKEMLAFIMHKPMPLPPKFRDVFYEEASKHDVLLDAIFEQASEESLQNPLNDRLSEIDTPTLIIWGRHDNVIDVSCASVLAEGISGSECEIFEEMGHMPMMEDPSSTAQCQMEFLDKY